MSNGKEKKAKLISDMAEGVIRKNIICLSVACMFVLLCLIVWLEGVYFIQKPFSMQDLSDKVRQVLDD